MIPTCPNPGRLASRAVIIVAISAMAAVQLALVFAWITALALAAAVVVARAPERAVMAFSLIGAAVGDDLGVIRRMSRSQMSRGACYDSGRG